MNLLMVRLDPDTIRVVGKWQSNIILCYLHTTANSFTKGLLAKIFKHSTYTLIPPMHAVN